MKVNSLERNVERPRRSATAFGIAHAPLPARATFEAATPFPHVVIDDFLADGIAREIHQEFDRARSSWTYYHHANEWKRGCADLSSMGETTRAVIATLSAPPFLRALETVSGIDGLLADPELDGGGLHETLPGGFLNVHVDFLAHTTRPSWSRQLNLLLFLNPEWRREWGGDLEFWDRDVSRCVRSFAPLFNRCVIFWTTPYSFHGVPGGVQCPDGLSRRSLALYYFRNEGRRLRLRPTHYVPRPSDSARVRALIALDGAALRVYAALKRYTPFGDRFASAILRRFRR